MLDGAQVITVPNPTNLYIIPQGQTFVFPFAVGFGNNVDVAIIHTGFVQDHTIRGWISTVPTGQSIALNPPLGWWSASRIGTHVEVYDTSVTPKPINPLSIGVPFGTYYANIMNLCNETNSFSLKFTSTTVSNNVIAPLLMFNFA